MDGRATAAGHVAKAYRAGQVVTVTAPSSGLAWALVWRCVAASAARAGG